MAKNRRILSHGIFTFKNHKGDLHKMKTRLIAILITLTTIVSFPSCDLLINLFPPSDDAATASIDSFMNHEAIISTPMSDDLAFIEVNGNKPQFTEEDFNNGVYYYKLTPLDELGRVRVAIGLFDAEHMPDGERGDIDSVTPTGWKTDGISLSRAFRSPM